MFPLLLHASTAFQEAQLLWEQQPWQSCSCSSREDLGLVFLPLEAAVETNASANMLQLFLKACAVSNWAFRLKMSMVF